MAAINLGFVAKYYKALMYGDRMWVWRHVKLENDWDGIDSLLPQTDESVALYKNIECRISPNPYKDTTKDSNSYNIPVDWQPILFWQPDIELLPMDYVKVVRGDDGTIYTGYIGEPQSYQSHNQALMRRNINA